jgi:hypothetical protein
MQKDVVLIIGQRPDLHIDTVVERLQAKFVDALVFDRYDPQQSVSVSLGSNGVSGKLHINGDDIDFRSIKSVWWRVKPAVPSEFSGGHGSLEETFRVQEWRDVLKSLSEFLSHAGWVNPLASHHEISRKPLQLSLAAKVGLHIPETVISNDHKEILKLFRNGNRVIYKTTSSFLIPPDELIFTNEVSRDEVVTDATALSLAPGIFQTCIEKLYELRITVVGTRHYVVKIDSQSSDKTALDWRRQQDRAMYSHGNLSANTLERLLQFHKQAGIVYGAYDFIVDKEGREIFLECNPGGQWLWLDNNLSLGITDGVVDLLLKPLNKVVQ